MKKVNIDFFFSVYEKNQIPEIYARYYDSSCKVEIINSMYNESDFMKKSKIYSVFYIPDYIRPLIDENFFKVLKVNQFFKGYAIFLYDFQNVNNYIKFRFKKNANNIFKKIKRLETCFTINYNLFFGEIKKQEYKFLMDCMHTMLIERFNQRGEISAQLGNWDTYFDLYCNLINKKQASLFVIYENSNPIAISLNLHFNKKLFGVISSYDIDFAKFSLGTVDIYKKLEWCLENQYNVYEMGMGDLSYKREWVNHIYHFEHQIIYSKKALSFITAKLIYYKIVLKELVYKLTYVPYQRIKTKLKKSNNSTISYKIIPLKTVNFQAENTKINYNNYPNQKLRKFVFDFIYTNKENVKDVEVFEISKDHEYNIIGKLKMQKIIFDRIR